MKGKDMSAIVWLVRILGSPPSDPGSSPGGGISELHSQLFIQHTDVGIIFMLAKIVYVDVSETRWCPSKCEQKFDVHANHLHWRISFANCSYEVFSSLGSSMARLLHQEQNKFRDRELNPGLLRDRQKY